MFNTSSFNVRVFSLAGIDVRITAAYLFFMAVVAVFSAYSYGSVLSGVAVVFALTLSLLIHEFGHALVAKSYKLRPSIVLHGLGGTCVSDPAPRDLHDFLITVAGPSSEIIAGVLVLIASIFLFPETPSLISTFISSFIYFSIVWGGINLLIPIYPLDGGRLFLLLMRRYTTTQRAASITLKLSMILCLAGAILFIYFKFIWLALICAMILYDNYQAEKTQQVLIQRFSQHRSQVRLIQESFDEIERQFKSQNWQEASRLCHLFRSQMNEIPDEVLNRIWIILGVSALKMDDYQEALLWLKRAPKSPEVEALKKEVETMELKQKM